ncbi:MAG: hypothetical protein IJI07_01975 [Flexilinea sp.]|nr:hypothetical protein [Flexilinea sp.]
MERKHKQAPLYLLTGLLVGLALGLLIGYRMLPVQFFDIAPSSLQPDYQRDYLALVGLAYNADKDIGRGYSRISQMMSPVDIDTLRTMSLKLNDSPDTQGSYEPVRTFINDLLTYMTETGHR